MNGPLPLLRVDETVRALEREGFSRARQKGSHVRMHHSDGRCVTVPVHSGKTVGRGLLRKILRDAKLTRDEFQALL